MEVMGHDHREIYHQFRSLLGRVTCQAYAFDQPFEDYNLAGLLEDFVNSPSTATSFEIWRGQLKETLGKGAHLEDVERVPCQLTSMKIFQRLYESGIVREDGEITRCLEEYHDELILDDHLKKMLVQEDGEFWSVYDEEERQELLFLLFKMVSLGGECCQSEDNVSNYLNVTRTLYRDIVSPQVENGTVVVRSVAAKVRLKTADGTCVPEEPQFLQNLLLVVVNSHTRTLHTLLHQHGVGILD